MTILKHELKLSKTSFMIWTLSIGTFMLICIFLYPSMKDQMEGISDAFASMGTFSNAFGLDKINFGSLMGYYGVECGNVLGIGGAFYAAITGANVLSKEEKEHTAEFLITHPIKRRQIVTGKLLAIIIQIVLLNIIIFLLSILSFVCIKETPIWKEFILLHCAYSLMQIEIAGICFGISSVVRKNSLSIGLGFAIIAYFLNIIANLTENVKWLKYLTAFGYCDGADIIATGKLSLPQILVGYGLAISLVVFAFYYYNKKDIKD